MKLRKIFVCILFLLFLLPLVIAQTEYINDFNDYSNLDLNFKLDTKFDLVSTNTNSRIEELNAFLTFFPENDTLQTINSLKTYSNPKANINFVDNEFVYRWDNPNTNNFNFGLEAKLTTTNALVIIDNKVDFPLKDVVSNYLKPTKFIDITPEIKDKASELAYGEDDLYIVAFKIGDWVRNNIDYNLSTLTAEVVQKSSWVLENKQGVCDELTNLFISMMRSLGIPARFVSGLAYTNLGHTWGSHGWAEVYFPDKGWVPFDVTYGQLGWIDPGHIKLKQSVDSGEAAIRYTWKSVNEEMQSKGVILNASLISTGAKINPPLEFNIKTLTNNVGPGSFVPIMLEVKNRNDYYFPASFFVTRATNLTDSNIKNLLLKPGEIKRIFWITKIPDYAKENYVYTSSIEIENQFHKKVNTNITYSKNLDIVTLDKANELISKNQYKEEARIVSKTLSLNCISPDIALSYEDVRVKCEIKNNNKLKNIFICLKQECKNIDLEDNAKENLEFLVKLNPGAQSLVVTANSDDISVSDVNSIYIIENPGLQISNAVYPNPTSYLDKFNFTIILTTSIPVKDVQINIDDNPIMKLDSVIDTKQIIIFTSGKDLYNHNNKLINIKIDYKDLNDKIYNTKYDYALTVLDVPWYIKLLAFLHLI